MRGFFALVNVFAFGVPLLIQISLALLLKLQPKKKEKIECPICQHDWDHPVREYEIEVPNGFLRALYEFIGDDIATERWKDQELKKACLKYREWRKIHRKPYLHAPQP